MDILFKAAGKAITKAIAGKGIEDIAGKAIGAVVAGKVIGSVAGQVVNKAFEEIGYRGEENYFPNGKRTTRKDLKLAQLQIEKARIDEQAKRQELARAMIAREANVRSKVVSQVTDILYYTKNNMGYIFSVVRSLRDDCLYIKDRMEEAQLQISNASFREKRQIKKDMIETKKIAYYKFGCLYLSKEYLLLLSMFANGLVLNDVQSGFIVKFAPFFSGVKVLEIEDTDIEEDDETIRTINRTNVDAKSGCNLDLSEFLMVYFKEQLARFVLPDIEEAFQLFTKAANNKGIGNPLKRSAIQYCEYCGCAVEKNYGTCTHCGAPV
jgi:hypothetical protein